MERKLTKLEHSHVEVVVKVDEASWKAAQEKAFKKLAADVTVDGFRKGKAPENLVKAKVDPVKVMDEAINGLLPTIYKDILDNEDVKPFAQPKVDVTKLSETELEVKFLIVTAPEIKIGAYKDLKVGRGEVKVTDEDVNAAVDATLRQSATLVVKEGAAAKGDTVVMDFVGRVAGKEFEGGAAKNHELKLGSGQFIPGFEDQLVGAKAGDKVVVKVKFPENYTAELKGKDAEFECDVHEVKEEKLPELNDEFVKGLKMKDVETVDAFKAAKKVEIENNKKAEEKRTYVSKLLAEIAKNSKVDIPEEVIEQQIASRKQDLVQRMSQSGLTLEQYLSIIGQKEEDFNENLKKQSVADVTSFLIVQEVGKLEKLEVTDKDVEFEMAKLAEQYGMKLEDVKKALSAQLGEFINNIKMSRVEDFLVNNNK